MCPAEEQNVMVALIKRAGWVRTTVGTIIMIFTIIAATWGANERVENVAEEVVDREIRVHKLESEVEIKTEISELRTEQRVMDTKLDMLLRAEGLEPPE
ncbi:MAG: hypothetical protein ACYS7Y_35100 [Planctomycetota bacterium]|jgi:hypothetical protein